MLINKHLLVDKQYKF